MKMWMDDEGRIIHDTTRFISFDDLLEDAEKSFERKDDKAERTRMRTLPKRFKRKERIKRPLRNYYSNLDGEV